MIIRKLNDKGLLEYATFLISNHKEIISNIEPPKYLLEDDEFSEALNFSIEAGGISLQSRFDFGKYYFGLLDEHLSDEEYEDQGIWAWLTLFHWDEIYDGECPRLEAFIPLGAISSDKTINSSITPFKWTSPLEYRHPIKGYYYFYKMLGDDCEIFIAESINKHGDVCEALGSRLWFRGYPMILKTLRLLFWDTERKKILKHDGTGALTTNTSSRGYRGGLRRALKVFQKLMAIYDLNSFDEPKEVVDLMGNEFKPRET